MSKLDSKSRLGTNEFAFYADVDGDVREERFADALRELEEYTSSLHIIGSYDAGTAPPRVRGARSTSWSTTPRRSCRRQQAETELPQGHPRAGPSRARR